ncbi:MAG TPA: hypothetical protein QF499_11185 [Gammaproteobacteria bacterium]|jgi:hypothetical protein|nr:hypothetical protein [Chromatiales bacterium]MCP4925988.1 hypothetical protein [Gammaproteobacteria bacterium]HJP39673.1 hypothetical protein [Gammaproteobacteria bacterium]
MICELEAAVETLPLTGFDFFFGGCRAAYTPAEIATVLGGRYGFKGKMASMNYLLAVYKL